MPIYLIQEVFLAEYLSRQGPAKVLEFGCGFGRHLSYLNQIPGLRLAGCDQSASMIEGIRQWASEEWMAEHVCITDPRTKLPYPDKSFDVVFTVSVLIHVHPEDVAFVLSELLRVCRWQLLHIENARSPQALLTADAHAGCWAHPFEQHFERLGHRAEVLTKPFHLEDVYRVILDSTRPVVDLNPQALGKLLQLDEMTSRHIEQLETEARANAHETSRLGTECENLKVLNRAHAETIERLREEIRELEAKEGQRQQHVRELRERLARHAAFARRLDALLSRPV
jgi:SAM-dependent methyltransferase